MRLALPLLALTLAGCVDAGDPESSEQTSASVVVGSLTDATDSINWSTSYTGSLACPGSSEGIPITSCYAILRKGELVVDALGNQTQWSYAFIVWNRTTLARVIRYTGTQAVDFRGKLENAQALASLILAVFDSGTTGTGTSGPPPHNPHPNGDGGLHLDPLLTSNMKSFVNQIIDINARAQAYTGP